MVCIKVHVAYHALDMKATLHTTPFFGLFFSSKPPFCANWIFSAPPCDIGAHMRNTRLAPARIIAGKLGHLVFGPQLSRKVRTSCLFSLYNLTPPTIHSVQGLSSSGLTGSQRQGIPLIRAGSWRRNTCSCIPAGHRSVLPR